jgi:hypothetical protein
MLFPAKMLVENIEVWAKPNITYKAIGLKKKNKKDVDIIEDK